jgi:hypothetical protein
MTANDFRHLPDAELEKLIEQLTQMLNDRWVTRGTGKFPVVEPRGPRFRKNAARGELAEMAGETCFTIPAKLSEVGT